MHTPTRPLFGLALSAVVTLGGGLVLGACQAAIPTESDESLETGSAAAAILGGYLDSDDTESVGIVHLSNMGFGACSGTLIAPNLILTAHHCVADSSSGGSVACGSTVFYEPHAPSELYVTTRTSFTQNIADYHLVREILVPPGGNGFCGNDIALMILDKPIAASEALPAVPRVDAELLQFEEYYAVGFGAQGDTQSSNSGTRFRRDGLFTQCIGTGCGLTSGVAPSEWRGDTGICSGDSGGGAFDLFHRVHGVASRGAQGCSFPIYGGIFGWADWMKDSAVYAAGLAGLDPPPWATGFPTDPLYSHPVGAACSSLDACPSGACLNGYCTRACTDLATCPDGFSCNQDAWCEADPGTQPNATKPKTTLVVGNGCQFLPPDPTKPTPWEIAPLAGALVWWLRRRRASPAA